MGVGVHLVLLLIACSVTTSLAQVWQEPYFKELENPIEELEYDEKTANGWIIYLDEEVDANNTNPVYLVEIEYSGTEVPQLSFTSGSPSLLGAQVRKDGARQFVVITERQDYEVAEMQRYSLAVNVGAVRRFIFLNIRNIDDNRPVVSTTGCDVPELYVGPTNCTYKVFDADGDISTDYMKFTIVGRAGEERLFDVDPVKVNSYNMDVHLRTIKELDYFLSQLHIFDLIATDSAPQNGTGTAIVQVIDMPNRDPEWKSVFAIQTFNEKTPMTFRVEAVDGDTGINKPIYYRLKGVDDRIKENVTIEMTTGVIDVKWIDRDALKQEVFSFNIGAYKFDNETWETDAAVVFIIVDINDNEPVVNRKEFNLTIEEEKYVPLDFVPNILIDDIDLGDNAQYDVELISVDPPQAKDAFLIVPNAGYQDQDFQITIVDASLLDYDNVDVIWRVVKLQIKATEKANSSHVGTALVTINLENWNDEVPIFRNESARVQILETAEKGEYITTMLATDRDIDDRIEYSLVGIVNDFLDIDPGTGAITVGKDDAFDYQVQSEIIVQVLVKDTLGEPYHSVYAQLVIGLIDVNNKPPEIRLPRTTPEVEEHRTDNFIITDEVTGSDPDSSARIEFAINWDDTYAMKQGRRTKREEYEGCIEIETVYRDPNKTGNAYARLKTKTMTNGKTMDFEEFEVLYLVIRLTDHEQEIGNGFTESMLTIIVIDINDNAPIWVNGTLTAKRFVREEADSETVIGTLLAIDIDGPGFNEVTYSLKAVNNTPDDLVKINSLSGQLEVSLPKAIDADIPKRYFLYYNVTASDCNEVSIPNCYNTTDRIEIEITDTNNKNPFALENEYDTTLYVYENETTGFEVVTLKSYDYDRDEPYSKVNYRIDYALYPELRNYFSVNLTTGKIIVDLRDGAELDRDNPETAEHTIHLVLSDNFELVGDRIVKENRTTVLVVLLDVNDNAPQLPPPETYRWTVSENTTKGHQFEPSVVAPDIDEEDTDNSRVQYEVLGVQAIQPPDKEFPEDLFDILSPDNVSGILIANHDLRKYWGTYGVWLRAFDLGVPSLSTNETYQVTVTPYNYMAPEFEFPKEGGIIRLAKENVVPGQTLYTTSGKELDLFYADDADGLEAGMVEFDIVGNELAQEHFEIQNLENKRGKLILKKIFTEGNTSFALNVRARDKGIDPGPLQTIISISVVFVSTQGQPVYDKKTQFVRFKEFEEGLSHIEFLNNATDPRNEDCIGEECVPIYYHIIDGNQGDLFKLDVEKNILSLKKELNRTAEAQHVLRIAANNDLSPPNLPINPDSILAVTVDVREANPRPIFTKSTFTAGIASSDVSGKILLTLEATHTEGLPMRYKIVPGSMDISDNSLSEVKDSAFMLDEITGQLNLTFRPTNSMKGIFTFTVTATDTLNKVDEAECKVFLVADNNKVSFIFDNVLKYVEEERTFIANTFTKNFKFLCNIDSMRIADNNGIQLNNQTEVISHFIDPKTEIAVEAKEIEDQKSNVILMAALQNDLAVQNLTLSGFTSTNPDNKTDDITKTLQIILIVVSTVLGSLCIVLLVAYCIRTRRLNQRLKALSTTKFGSQSSDMNRIGVAVVPGTNKHAIEGSNPVWNEEINTPQFDTASVTSGDSDLIGIEENPQFAYENGKK